MVTEQVVSAAVERPRAPGKQIEEKGTDGGSFPPGAGVGHWTSYYLNVFWLFCNGYCFVHGSFSFVWLSKFLFPKGNTAVGNDYLGLYF